MHESIKRCLAIVLVVLLMLPSASITSFASLTQGQVYTLQGIQADTAGLKGNMNVGAVTYGMSLGDSANYLPPPDFVIEGRITARKLLIEDPVVTTTKAYDGNDIALAIPGEVLNRVDGDDVTVTIKTSTYNDVTVQGANLITVTYQISGADSSNYAPPDDYTIEGSITKKAANPTWPSKAELVYGQSLSEATFVGGGEEGVYTFVEPSTKPTVAESGDFHEVLFTPNDADNYSSSTKNIAVMVSKAPVTVSQGSFAVTKPYDTVTTTGTMSGYLELDGVVNNETDVDIFVHDYPSVNAGQHSVELDLSLTNEANHELISNSLTINSGEITRITPVDDVHFTSNVGVPRKYAGSAHPVTITPTSPYTGLGTATVYYDGSTTAPINAGYYIVSVTFNEGLNFEEVTTPIVLGTMYVEPEAPEIVFPATASVTYGQPLSEAILEGESSNIPGRFVFDNAANKPAVPDTGTTEGIKFIPDDTVNYTEQSGTVDITVNKAVVTVTQGTYKVSKDYDTTTSAGTASGALSLSGVVNSETGVTATVNSYPSPTSGKHSVVLDLVLTDDTNHVLSSDKLTITDAAINKIDVEADVHFSYDIDAKRVFNNRPWEVTITPTPPYTGLGTATVYYDGEVTKPITVGDYAVEVSFAEGTNFKATASNIPLGTLTIKPAPTVDVIYDGDEIITGEGEPGHEIIIVFPDGTEVITTVDEDGNWEVDIPEGVEPPYTVVIKGTDEEGDEAGEVVVVTRELVTLNEIYTNSQQVSGTGEPNDIITVLRGSTVLGTATIDENGEWIVNTSTDFNLAEEIHITGEHPSGRSSGTASVLVKTIPVTADLYEGASRITGTGHRGDLVEIGFVGYEVSEVTSINPSGDWEVTVPTGVAITTKSKINLEAQSAETGNKVYHTSIPVKRNTIVDPIQEGDDVITGEGHPGDKIIIDFGDGNVVEVIVDEDGNWSVTIPDGVDKTKPPALIGGGNDGATDLPLVVKDGVTVNVIYEGDKEVIGTGHAGDDLTIDFLNGKPVTVKIGQNGKWVIKVPEDVTLTYASKPILKGNKNGSDTVLEVRRKTSIDNINEGDRVITGEGHPGETIIIDLGDGNVLTVVVDENGRWSIDIPEGVNIDKNTNIKLSGGNHSEQYTVPVISKPTPSRPSGGGGGGGSGGGGGGGGGGGLGGFIQNMTMRWIEKSEVAPVLQSPTVTDMTSIKSNHGTTTGVRLDALKVIADAGLRYTHDTVSGNVVLVRVHIDYPYLATGDLLVSGHINGNKVDKIQKRFETYFDNTVRVVSFDQKGAWGQNVRVAARVDLKDMNTKSLKLYHYDGEKNRYILLPNSSYRIDKNGYLWFSTPYAGDIVITDKALTAKKAR